MKFSIHILALFMSVNYLNAQVKNDTVTTATGFKYVITKKNPTGIKAVKGDKVEARYRGTLTNGKKFDSSTYVFVIGKQEVIAGWDEGFACLRQGESATFIIPPSLGYGSQDMGDIPPNSTLVFEVELLNVKKPMPYIPFSGKGKDTVKLASGLKYIVISPGDPKTKAKAGQTASIYYEGYLLDGTKFSGNFSEFAPEQIPVVTTDVIRGWQEILPLMHKGMKLRVIIPPYLAFGEKGYPGVIPANATLVFDMYLSDLN